MRLNELNSNDGSVHAKKRVGRGNASGHGTTAGRGNKGHKSRSGWKNKFYFEGGQMPLSRRLPKRGFRNIFKRKYAVINVEVLNRYNDDEIITPERLVQEGLVKNVKDGVKVLSRGEINKRLTVRAHRFSEEAVKKIKSSGGKVEVI